MLTRIHIKNFKRFDDVAFDLGQAVVLIGPNNSGKTTALQALALWDAGLRRWNERRHGKPAADKRPGVAVNRRDLITVPVPNANLLWRGLHVRNVEKSRDGQRTQNIRIDITVEGVTVGREWACGLEFDYANEESFYCRPLRLSDAKQPKRMDIPVEAEAVQLAFLPPMSGLAAVEPKWEPGRINVLIGEGQTAQVLRNLCFQIYEQAPGNVAWSELQSHIRKLFGITLLAPQYIQERGEITMAYKEPDGLTLDLSSSGRGLQQTLLLLAHLYANPRTVLLLDEPDAHLEVLRQRQIYQVLTEVAKAQGSQIVAASHSEVVLNEAAERDMVIAFVGSPHLISSRGSQVLKALTDLGFDQYYQAEQTGWVLYLEGATDLAILRAFAKTLDHDAAEYLDKPFVHYVGSDRPEKARGHFYGLHEAKPDLVGLALFDHLDRQLQVGSPLAEIMWRQREIENYLCQEEVLMAYARYGLRIDDLFGFAEAKRGQEAMREAIDEIVAALRSLGREQPWSANIKASDNFLDPLFDSYFRRLGLQNQMRKTSYNVLAGLVPADRIDSEVSEKLDAIASVARQAKPRQG